MSIAACLRRPFAYALLASALLLPPPGLAEDDQPAPVPPVPVPSCKNHFILSCKLPVIEWSAAAKPLAVHGLGLTATTLMDGRVLVAGGDESPRAAEIYDPVADAWSLTAPMRVDRALHQAVLLADGRVMVVGGDNWQDWQSWTRNFITAEIFDPETREWTAAAPLLVPRLVWMRDLSATLLQDGTVLVVGGNAPTADGIPLAETFDPASGRWHLAGRLSQWGIVGHTATLLPDGKVLVSGGATDWDMWFPMSSTEIYDPASRSWTQFASAAGATNQTATLLADGRVLVAGGQGNVPSSIGPPGSVWPEGVLPLASLYDAAAAGWTSAGSLVTSRYDHVTVALPGGDAIAIGGRFSDLPFFGGYYVFAVKSAERYDARGGTWNEVEQLGVPPAEPQAAAILPDGRVLIVGIDGAAWMAATP